MTNENDNIRQHQLGTESPENGDRDRTEQFNELSELSLEERMAVADQIGVPVRNVGEAAATGTASGGDVPEGGNDRMMEDETTDVGPDR